MQMWIFFALLSAFFAALVAIFAKIGLSRVDPTFATTLRVLVMAVFFILVSFFTEKWSLFSALESRMLLFIVLSGLAGALSWLFYFFALREGPASGVAALDRLSVVFVVLLAIFFLGEGISWKVGIGTLFLTAGAFLMVL